MEMFYHQRSSQCHDVIPHLAKAAAVLTWFGGKRQKNKEKKEEKGNRHVISHLTNNQDKSPSCSYNVTKVITLLDKTLHVAMQYKERQIDKKKMCHERENVH